MKKRLTCLACALALIIGLFSGIATASAAEPGFSDVPGNTWYTEAVNTMAADGIIKGFPDGTFRPNQEISYAELIALMVRALPLDPSLGPVDGKWAGFLNETMPDHWALPAICEALHREAVRNVTEYRESWDRIVTREDMVLLAVQLYGTSVGRPELHGTDTPALIIGDWDEVQNSPLRDGILWLYYIGVVTGTGETHKFELQGHMTRAQACVILDKLLHEDHRLHIDWDAVLEDAKNGTLYHPETPKWNGNKDFTGMTRVRYANDVAYDFCRQLEKQIGIQIFYLPEWTEKESGLLHYENIAGLYEDYRYFPAVLAELQKMATAFARYPDGFLKEMAAKKGSHKAEIILCPVPYAEGMPQYGVYVYDYSKDAQKVDQIYYCGSGDSHFYSHEMGHMVMSAAAIRNGYTAACNHWEELNSRAGTLDYVSRYAMTSRPEDWAETWAFLWEETETVCRQASSGSVLREKIQYMTKLLDNAYDSIDSSKLPWARVL